MSNHASYSIGHEGIGTMESTGRLSTCNFGFRAKIISQKSDFILPSNAGNIDVQLIGSTLRPQEYVPFVSSSGCLSHPCDILSMGFFESL
eukprot:4995396-Amphidinium_carterae.2